jgi:hypothetical protein
MGSGGEGLAVGIRAFCQGAREHWQTPHHLAGRVVRTLVLTVLAVGLTTCGGGLSISQLAHATKIVVVNTNPSDDPTGKGFLISYYMPLKLENALGLPVTLKPPQNAKGSPKRAWRGTLTALKDCVVFKPRLMARAS